MTSLEQHVRHFLANPLHSYQRLAEHLNSIHPRTDGSRWTKDSAYHFCRSNGITSSRRCRSQPAASAAKRRNNVLRIVQAAIAGLAALKLTPRDIAPFTPKEIAMWSGESRVNVTSNWQAIDAALRCLAGLAPRPIVLQIHEDDD